MVHFYIDGVYFNKFCYYTPGWGKIVPCNLNMQRNELMKPLSMQERPTKILITLPQSLTQGGGVMTSFFFPCTVIAPTLASTFIGSTAFWKAQEDSKYTPPWLPSCTDTYMPKHPDGSCEHCNNSLPSGHHWTARWSRLFSYNPNRDNVLRRRQQRRRCVIWNEP